MLEEIFKTLEGLSKQAMLYPKQRKDNPNFEMQSKHIDFVKYQLGNNIFF